MLKIEKISGSVTYIGSLDPELKTFDIIMTTKFGSTYNSYLVDCGEELALIDTSKEHYFEEYFEALNQICDIQKIKYLIVNHTEPDHSGEIKKLLERMPWLKIVASLPALGFLKEIANREFDAIEVKEGFELQIGNKKFKFAIVPNLHWPDTIFTYIEEDNIIFTCDVFAAHYQTSNVFADQVENKEDYDEAFKYYYDCIFSPFKPFVISGLNKITDKRFNLVCPSHGPVIRENFDLFKERYIEWSKILETNSDKISIVYTSAYGYTEKVAEEIRKAICEEGFNVVMIDLLEKSKEEALYEIDTSCAYLVGSPTINGDAVQPIWDLLMSVDHYRNRGKLAGAFGSYGWSGEAVKNIESRLAMLHQEVFRPGLKIRFNPNDERKLREAYTFGLDFAKKILSSRNTHNGDWVQIKTGKWKCLVCGEIFEGDYPPDECPVCGASADQFIEYNEEVTSFKSDTNEKIVILGSGISAISAAEKIRKSAPNAIIDIITEEKDYPYYRILLSKSIAGEKELNFKDQKWFEEKNINLRLGIKVFTIDEKDKKVILEGGEIKEFDKLIIATGARSRKLDIRGNDKNGVFVLRDKKDYENLLEYSQKEEVNDIVVLGGGILGIEIATGFKSKGKNVSIVENSPRLMIKQLDEKGSKLLKSHLEKEGINIFTNENVEEIYGAGETLNQVCALKLGHSGNKINCQMIVISVGIKANTEFIENTSIKTERGIVVDNTMKTSVENIYACGDVAQFQDKCLGLWSIASEMGIVAGANCVGDESKKYSIKPIAVSFNELGFKIFSIGDLGFEHNCDEYEELELFDPRVEKYKKFYFYNNEFVGGILIGDTSKAVQLRKAMEFRSNMQTFLESHFLE